MSKSSYLDISERKLLLRTIDIFLYVSSLWAATYFLEFSYINFTNADIYLWIIILIVYALLFGEIFQLYNLDVSNNRFKVVRSIFLTTFTTTFFYFFTPFITPSLPEYRIQIFYFFLFLSFPVIIWRFLYIILFYSPKYFKNILIVGHSTVITTLLYLINEKGFHKVCFYFSDKKIDNFEGFKDVKSSNLLDFGSNNLVSEIIVSTTNFDKSSIEKLNKDIIILYEKGVEIKSFDDFYEEITERIPRSYLDFELVTA